MIVFVFVFVFTLSTMSDGKTCFPIIVFVFVHPCNKDKSLQMQQLSYDRDYPDIQTS